MNLNRVTRVVDRVPLRNALISVADKQGLADCVVDLWRLVPDLTIYSTGGTFDVLMRVAERDGRADQVVPISDYTGQPEMQGGLVKTLDFRIYLGLLSESFNDSHRADLERTASLPFDLTICNFYPFERASAAAGATVEELRTHIDIGGPTMLRASAKNWLRVAAIHSPTQYASLHTELADHDGATTLAYRALLAAEAFRYTAAYEAAIADRFSARLSETGALDTYHVEPTQ